MNIHSNGIDGYLVVKFLGENDYHYEVHWNNTSENMASKSGNTHLPKCLNGYQTETKVQSITLKKT